MKFNSNWYEAQLQLKWSSTPIEVKFNSGYFQKKKLQLFSSPSPVIFKKVQFPKKIQFLRLNTTTNARFQKKYSFSKSPVIFKSKSSYFQNKSSYVQKTPGGEAL
jgi:hypothetical protein